MRLPLIVLVAAIVAATSYAATWGHLPHWPDVAWKGAGVSLLALYAALTAKGTDGRLLVLVMIFGALGDMLLEIVFVLGALAFLVGHLFAVWLYLRNRRPTSGGDLAVAGAIFLATVVAAWLLPLGRETAPAVTFYATGLGAMAAAAWLSRFPRALTAAGALMFVVSDELIFARAGRASLDVLPVNLAVWGLYFAGQTLIVLGVSRTLAAGGTGGKVS
jgi:uncharacterized membrane protein YhhN